PGRRSPARGRGARDGDPGQRAEATRLTRVGTSTRVAGQYVVRPRPTGCKPVGFSNVRDLGHLAAQRRGQVDLVLLLVDEDLADLFSHRVLAQGLALADAPAVVADGLVLVLQVALEHLPRVLRDTDRLGHDGRHAAEVVDLLGDDEGVLQLLLGVFLQ